MAEKDDKGFFEDTPGTYVIQIIYAGLFLLGYLWLFWELSHRWPVR